jgi:hypothetical protein
MSTPTRTRTRTPTPTRTPAEGTFVITFHSNTNGSSGVGGAGAQIQLSGSPAFPTISWGAGVGNAQQVTVGGNPGGLLYSIHADDDDEGVLYPLRSPVRYGNYAIPNTIQLIGSAAPALAAGPSYIATVVPLNFTGFTASIVFRVNP